MSSRYSFLSGVFLTIASLLSGASNPVPPVLINYSGAIGLYAQGVFLGNGSALFTYRHQARAELIVSSSSEKWSSLSFAEAAPGVFAAFASIDEKTWLARNGSDVWVSRDKGRSWQKAAAVPPLALKSDSVALSELGRLGALAWDTSSGSLLWLGSDDQGRLDFRSVCRVSSNGAVAAVRFGGKFGAETFGLLKTEDGGRHWAWLVKEGAFSFDESGNYPAHHIFFLTTQSGWISSDSLDDVYHTSDGGRTWAHITAPDRVISALYFRNENEGRSIGGSTARIYETKDGGKSWRELTDQEVSAPSFVEYFAGTSATGWNDFAVYRLVLARH